MFPSPTGVKHYEFDFDDMELLAFKVFPSPTGEGYLL